MSDELVLPTYTCKVCGRQVSGWDISIHDVCFSCSEGYIKHPSDIPLLEELYWR